MTKKKVKKVDEIVDRKRFPTAIPVIPFPETRILFKELPNDRILVTGFENFLTIRQIETKFGKTVAESYVRGNCILRIVTEEQDILSLMQRDAEKTTEPIYTGCNYSKAKFGDIIATIKKCGKTLHDIIVAVNGESKQIKI